ncbi:MAG: folylpolyglutamate synthase/dihydrofolate synthase family protein, partial [Anaerolineaceae bacterium]|nr:folylpolyglutamate synthase/dihydrofolate synthase family protein [Anaerolineaceae bacterium]
MHNDIAYQQALDYLYSFVDYSLTRAFRYTPDKFDLGRVRKLMACLGNPHLAYPVIHVAGTKGKGSTAAMIDRALREAGYKVGFYTSPHLMDFNERIQINGKPITRCELVEFVDEIKPHVEKIEGLTTFELTTALGFMFFARQMVDAAVVEVGLGGRLDATNVVDPLVSVITSISYDHMNVLGNTLTEIAGEKAGIIKPGKTVVMAPQQTEARLVVERIAQERGCRLVRVGTDYLFSAWAHSLAGQSLLVWSAVEQPLVNAYIESGGRQAWEPTRLSIPLLGQHQVENAATAYAALQVARKEGLIISEVDIARGFKAVQWPARFEVLRRNPPLIIDSAHNRDSALKLRHAIDDYLAGQPVILIFGASEDKDVAGMFSELLPRVRMVIATES